MNSISAIRTFSLFSNVTDFSNLTNIALRSFGYLVSLGRLPIGLYGLVTASFLDQETIYGSIGTVLLVPADLGGSLVFFERIGAIGLVAHFALFVSFAYGAAYLPIAIDSIIVLNASEKKRTVKHQAILNLANAVAQIALATFVIIGYSHPGLIVPFVVFAAVFGSSSFAHRHLVLLREK